MAALRWRPNGVCASTAGDVPGGTVHVKTSPRPGSPKGSFPVSWLGFIEAGRARRLPLAQKSKIIATAVTDGDVIASTWRDLNASSYVLGMLVHLPGNVFGVFGVLDNQNWPIVLSEDNNPRLTVVTAKERGEVIRLTRSG
ncbi:MAG: hypothetical protein EOO52_13150 [Gammaproteobacteria bacterium]|nr:MAG: hypothetical protein EOO52_13150 [Gammaproteobacteria bacterium]